jgi:hypothetical protein
VQDVQWLCMSDIGRTEASGQIHNLRLLQSFLGLFATSSTVPVYVCQFCRSLWELSRRTLALDETSRKLQAIRFYRLALRMCRQICWSNPTSNQQEFRWKCWYSLTGHVIAMLKLSESCIGTMGLGERAPCLQCQIYHRFWSAWNGTSCAY